MTVPKGHKQQPVDPAILEAHRFAIRFADYQEGLRRYYAQEPCDCGSMADPTGCSKCYTGPVTNVPAPTVDAPQ